MDCKDFSMTTASIILTKMHPFMTRTTSAIFGRSRRKKITNTKTSLEEPYMCMWICLGRKKKPSDWIQQLTNVCTDTRENSFAQIANAS